MTMYKTMPCLKQYTSCSCHIFTIVYDILKRRQTEGLICTCYVHGVCVSYNRNKCLEILSVISRIPSPC